MKYTIRHSYPVNVHEADGSTHSETETTNSLLRKAKNEKTAIKHGKNHILSDLYPYSIHEYPSGEKVYEYSHEKNARHRVHAEDTLAKLGAGEKYEERK